MIKLKNFSKKYNKYLLYNVSLDFFDTEKVIIINGKSGSGKSTFSNILLGLDTDYEGQILIDDVDIKNMDSNFVRNNIITKVFQENLLLSEMTVLDNLKTLTCSNDRKIIKELKKFGMYDTKLKKFKDLSGGEKQRICIIRCMLSSAKYIILDEPTSSLDRDNVEIFSKLLKMSNKYILIITHDDRINSKEYTSYILKDQSFLITNKCNSNKVHYTEKNEFQKFKLKQIIHYQFLTIINNPWKLFVNNFSLLFIILTFLIANGVLINSIIETKDHVYGGIDENSVVLDLSLLTEDYKEKNPTSLTNGKKLYFSEKDVEDIQNISGVKDIYLFQDTATSIGIEENGKSYTSDNFLEKEDYLNEIKSKNLISAPEIIEFNYETIPLEGKYMNYYSSSRNVDLISGTYPDRGEILIPDIYADYLEDEIDYTEIIGNSYEFNSKNNEEEIKVTYSISGVYDTEYEDVIEASYSLIAPKPEEDIFQYITYDTEMLNYGNELFSNETEWHNIVETGYSKMLIIAENTKIINDVESEITTLYPNNTLISRNSIKEGEYGTSIKTVILSNFVYYFIMIILFVIVIYFNNKSIFEDKKKNYALLFSCGYRYKLLKIGVIMNTFITNIFIVTLTYLLLKLISVMPFISISIDLTINYTFSIIAVIVAYIFIAIISIICSLIEIKKLSVSNLIEHLKT